MNKRIFKYTLTGPNCTFRLPIGSTILSALVQEPNIVFYALVPQTELSPNQFHFVCLNTGGVIPQEIEQTYKFLATLQTANGIVWHVYYSTVLGKTE